MGSIGGTILIGSLVVLFLFMKKRRRKMTNQLPDFADDSSGNLNEKFGGFRKIFGSKATSASAPMSGYLDLEGHPNAAAAGAFPQDTDDDFEYRGVSNSNNLDSVFRTSGSNTGQSSGGPNSSGGSVKQHSRLNSIYNPMSTMHEGPSESRDDVLPSSEHPSPGYPVQNDLDRHRSSEYDLEDDLFFNREPNKLWTHEGEGHSNNSRLRFTEEI